MATWVISIQLHSYDQISFLRPHEPSTQNEVAGSVIRSLSSFTGCVHTTTEIRSRYKYKTKKQSDHKISPDVSEWQTRELIGQKVPRRTVACFESQRVHSQQTSSVTAQQFRNKQCSINYTILNIANHSIDTRNKDTCETYHSSKECIRLLSH